MKRAIILSLLLAAGCVGAPDIHPDRATPPVDLHAALQIEAAPQAEPLPLRIPIKGVMAGVIDFSAHGVFTTATSDAPLEEADWIAAGLAAINLIGSATLITSAGSGPHDSAWVADPEWRRWAAAFQEASVSSAIAIRNEDREDYLRAANALADACQSCHERFRVTDARSPTEFAAQMADRSLTPYVRAWPLPASTTH